MEVDLVIDFSWILLRPMPDSSALQVSEGKHIKFVFCESSQHFQYMYLSEVTGIMTCCKPTVAWSPWQHSSIKRTDIV